VRIEERVSEEGIRIRGRGGFRNSVRFGVGVKGTKGKREGCYRGWLKEGLQR
jgi:hypothetical protein